MNLASYQHVSVVVISILVLVMSIDYLTGWMRKKVA